MEFSRNITIFINSIAINEIAVQQRPANIKLVQENILIVKTENNWKINDFMCIPSSHDLDTLRRIGIDMANKLSISMKNFFSIEIWEKSEYIKKMTGDNTANYRYHIGRK